MTLKEELVKFLEENGESELKEIYENFPNRSKPAVRSVLNGNLDKAFVRPKKATYDINDAETTKGG